MWRFSVVQGIYRALAAVGRPPHEIAFVSGIGCSSRIPGYTTAIWLQQRPRPGLPIAQGIKLANPDLLVLAAVATATASPSAAGTSPT